MIGSRLGKLAVAIAISIAAIVVIAGLVNAGSSDAAPADDHATHDHSHDHDHASILNHDGRFTGPGVNWPPEPKNATDFQAVSGNDVAAPVDAQGVNDVSAASPIERAAEASSVSGENAFDPKRFEVTASRDTLEPAGVDSPVDQAPLSDEEADEAVALARTWWADQGNTRVGDLEGFSIRAFQANGDFFPVRMVYVSFHLHNDAAPELLNLVDLTNGQVESGWLDQ